MYLTQIGINGFRNLIHVNLEPSPQFNILLGENGAGKSSVLEAIHLLSTGHSYRTRKIRELITLGQNELTITAQLMDPHAGMSHRAGVRRTRTGDTELKVDYQSVYSTADMARLVPVKALFPDSHRLILDGPSLRRQYIDWGLFHVNLGFFQHWKTYRRALEQRNQSLRLQLPDAEVQVWNQELSEAGEAITRLRQHYVNSVAALLPDYLQMFDVEGVVELSYKPGWSGGTPLLQALHASFAQCRRFRTTTVGPHRAEMSIDFQSVPARQILSRGQQKLLVYALHFAQLESFAAAGLARAIVLCDDLSAELDDERLAGVLACLQRMHCQTFITSNRTIQCPVNTGIKSFNMEHGEVLEVV